MPYRHGGVLKTSLSLLLLILFGISMRYTTQMMTLMTGFRDILFLRTVGKLSWRGTRYHVRPVKSLLMDSMRLHGRGMQEHVPPFNYIFPKVDISNPRTFLWIKRGILQYTVLKPFLAFATIIMKATHTFEDGYIGLTSGYFWSGLLYNLSVTISLYSLGFFWLCLYWDLKPFRPVPKVPPLKTEVNDSF
jgi:hypothetical protein